ncbi:MAG: SpoIIE family protein phosphatase [Acidobacteria bacterium]|nr:SpoIIE family protein phosphatase [Acidobacteriota bacterium]
MTPLIAPPRKLTFREALSRTGWWERLFVLFFGILILTAALALSDVVFALALMGMIATAPVALWRFGRLALRSIIWRLRNRLIVAYVFIALVPIVLLATLAAVTTYFVTGQMAIYLVNSELERQVGTLRGAAESVLRVPPERRLASIERLGAYFEERFPNFEIRVDQADTFIYPEDASIEKPPASLTDNSGILLKGKEYYVWAHIRSADGEVTAMAPLSSAYLSSLIPSLGPVSLGERSETQTGGIRIRKRKGSLAAPVQVTVPNPINRFDIQLTGFRTIPVTVWEGKIPSRSDVLMLQTRFLAVLKIIFSSKQDWDQNFSLLVLISLGGLLLVFEIIALIIGVTLTRTITATVHDIYEGTNRVMEGNFSHRILLTGRDQLAQLGDSFNRMTENLEQLLKVAKENERLNAELEIASEVQRQLYPKSVPASTQLAITAHYVPARMVSGDYFDFHRLSPKDICFSMGDVAGKGISAALLMATVQSSFRSREKFSTFFLGIFDEETSTLRCTNAGHLPTILIRNGEASLLAVDGMVVGAFPFAQYGESSIVLEPKDLLLLYTDGISEPQNDYDEMYGEDRLIELVKKNAHLSDEGIINAVMEAVKQWTGSDELQDDMTLLIARRS